MIGSPDPVNASALDELPPLQSLLHQGGDHRIAIGADGRNIYGFTPTPRSDPFEFSASTASTISRAAFTHCESRRLALVEALQTLPPEIVYGAGAQSVRARLAALLGCDQPFARADIVLCASGTDAHLVAAALYRSLDDRPVTVVMIEGAETGSGAPKAAAGEAFSPVTCLGLDASSATATPGSVTVIGVSLRDAAGLDRSAEVIDRDMADAVANQVRAGRRVLLIAVDGSKTGRIAPRPATLLALADRFPLDLAVMVDACQMRLSPQALGAYLGRNMMVAITGSKFVSGPAYSAALLIPPDLARPMTAQPPPGLLRHYSLAQDWPPGWSRGDGADLVKGANFGLLLRWEAALFELARFQALPPGFAARLFTRLAALIDRRLEASDCLIPLPPADLDRRPLSVGDDWDGIRTLFPFLIRSPAGPPQDFAAAVALHRCAMGQGLMLGQAVKCGAAGALRLSLSARLAVEAHAEGDDGDALTAQVLGAIDRIEALVRD